MGQTQPLSFALLERLEERLRNDHAQPLLEASSGLSDDEIQAQTATFPAQLPDESRLWWAWRTLGPGLVLPGPTQAVTLDAAIEHYEFRCRTARELADGPESPSDWWDPGWLPIFSLDGGIVVAIDATRIDRAIAPLRRIDWQGFGTRSFARVVALSLGEYVAQALDALDAGYGYETDLSVWLGDSERR